MDRPLVLGVAGGTASGKTTMANRVLDLVGGAQVAYLPHDAYYKHQPHLSFEERTQVNYDHPNSLETELLIEHVRLLLAGRPAERPIYDFKHHLRTPETHRVVPSPVILVDGILIYTDPTLRELMDIKLYVDTDSDLRFIRRMLRDVQERGRTLESVIEQYLLTVRPMHMQFVEPSKRYADVIIPDGGLNQVAIDMVVSRLRELLT
ncbi:MAG: uridine kinase [Anaerolineae bacterium]|nr:uridine kinase [Anaerolineae bacterium]MCO5191969.1 uridine kinase [Anaerolineae bacterium]MCO5200026.1 uridine kinase [Anaerolineae bacterium]MCO5207000.1 uridine kinase [Anaerolineae bacterium]